MRHALSAAMMVAMVVVFGAWPHSAQARRYGGYGCAVEFRVG